MGGKQTSSWTLAYSLNKALTSNQCLGKKIETQTYFEYFLRRNSYQPISDKQIKKQAGVC